MTNRRVPVHKDEWVTECSLLRVENTRLKNILDQMERKLKRVKGYCFCAFALATLAVGGLLAMVIKL